MDKDIKITYQLASSLHQYLLTKPMAEVEGLVSALRNSEPIENTASDRMLATQVG